MPPILSLINLLVVLVFIISLGWFALTAIRGQPRPRVLLYPLAAIGVIMVILALISFPFASSQQTEQQSDVTIDQP